MRHHARVTIMILRVGRLVSAALLAVILTPSSAWADVDCSDFSSRSAAQSHLDANPSDPDHLDADHDGKACERLGGGPVPAVVGLAAVGVAGYAGYKFLGRRS